MNLGWISTDPEITEEDRGVILHEFGHSLGYLHEHQSSRRSEKITLDEEGEYSSPSPYTVAHQGFYVQL